MYFLEQQDTALWAILYIGKNESERHHHENMATNAGTCSFTCKFTAIEKPERSMYE
jgi:hypothetical protein